MGTLAWAAGDGVGWGAATGNRCENAAMGLTDGAADSLVDGAGATGCIGMGRCSGSGSRAGLGACGDGEAAGMLAGAGFAAGGDDCSLFAAISCSCNPNRMRHKLPSGTAALQHATCCGRLASQPVVLFEQITKGSPGENSQATLLMLLKGSSAHGSFMHIWQLLHVRAPCPDWLWLS